MSREKLGFGMLIGSTATITILFAAVMNWGWPGVWLQAGQAGWKVWVTRVLFSLLLWAAGNGLSLLNKNKPLPISTLAVVPILILAQWQILGGLDGSPLFGLTRLLLFTLAWTGCRRFARHTPVALFFLAGFLFLGWYGLYPFPWNKLVPEGLDWNQYTLILCLIVSIPYVLSVSGFFYYRPGSVWRGIAFFMTLVVVAGMEMSFYSPFSPGLLPIQLLAGATALVLLPDIWRIFRTLRPNINWLKSGTAMAIAIALTILTVFALPLPTPRELETENQIYEAALRHFIVAPGPVYIAVNWDKDPHPDLLLQLSDLTSPLYGVSRSGRSGLGVWDRFTLQNGVLHRIFGLEWMEDGTVKLDYAIFYAALSGSIYEVTLEKTDADWIVIEANMRGIS